MGNPPPQLVPRLALVGVHGYGEKHLSNIARLEQAGAVELVAVADPRPPTDGAIAESVRIFDSLGGLLEAGIRPDIVVIATPLHTHADLARAAVKGGADVYLEKPPVASMAQFERLLADADMAGKSVQSGFQSLGSQALPAVQAIVDSGEIGEVRGVSATGTWLRSRGYFNRSAWAGRRSLDGVDVVDGVATNPLAHAVQTALHIAGARRSSDVLSVETDLYRAHDIEGDDTSVIRVRTVSGTTLTCALTLCAPEQSEPRVTVYGTLGQLVLYYTSDELVVTTGSGERRQAFGRTDLLENLVEHRNSGHDLLSALDDGGAFTTVLDAIRTADAPHLIDTRFVTWVGDGENAHPVVDGITGLIERAAVAQATFSELGVPWARDQPITVKLEVPSSRRGSSRPSFHEVAAYRDGSRVQSTSSPRPYLHPVSTLAGTVVTDHLPTDHVWHLGAGVAIQDVDGVNFWGGRTYTRQDGEYVWRQDHGRILSLGAVQTGQSLDEHLAWVGPADDALLEERRRWRCESVDERSWVLSLDFTLAPAERGAAGQSGVELGSPGSNGRPQGGYGGFFWRIAPCTDVDIRTADAHGEEAAHGSVARWLTWTARFDGAIATLGFVAGSGHSDPWFVRSAGYPGVGLSLSWDAPIRATRDDPVSRSVQVIVADGVLGVDEIESAVASAQSASSKSTGTRSRSAQSTSAQADTSPGGPRR